MPARGREGGGNVVVKCQPVMGGTRRRFARERRLTRGTRDEVGKADDGSSSDILFSSIVGVATQRVGPCSSWCASLGRPKSSTSNARTREVTSSTGTPDAGKVACPVWMRGKSASSYLCIQLDAKHGNRRGAASSSRATSRLLPLRRVNSLADVEGLDSYQARVDGLVCGISHGMPREGEASIGSHLRAGVGFSATCLHLPLSRAVVIADQQTLAASLVPTRRIGGPIDKLLMEEATSGAAWPLSRTPIPMLRIQFPPFSSTSAHP